MNWLTNLINKLFCFIPRILLVQPDEGGVRTTLGKHYSAVTPGWYIFWPLIQDCTSVTVTPQVVDLRAQSVLTQDGENVCIGGAVMYRIKDPVKAILRIQDFDESLQAMALGIIANYVGHKEFDECRNIENISNAVLKGIKENARGWGLEIMRVYVTDLGITKNLRILGIN